MEFSVMDHIHDIVSATSSWSLRLLVYYFTRWLPLGPRYLPLIYNAFTLFLAAALAHRYLLSKRPAPSSRLTSILLCFSGSGRGSAFIPNLIINACFLLGALDFVHRARILDLGDDLAFSRIGYVDDRVAKIVLRVPEPVTVSLKYRPEGATHWMHGSVQQFSNDTDFIETIVLSHLAENTSYQYRTNTTLGDSFRTTAKSPKQWSMVSSSCISPGFPYNPVGHSLEIPGLTHLSQYIQSRSIDFMLFLGDFIYIDLPVPQRQTNIDYRRAYRRVYASPSWTPALRDLPFVHTYDDHEFENDWASNTTGIFWDAIEPFQHYQGNANPPSDFNDSYYTFKRGDVSFFVTDARRYRSSAETVDGPGKTMLGKKQSADLKHWLATSPGLKVVVSSVPFTRNWRGPESGDSWAGYLHERQKILQAMWDTQGVIIISGDRHEHATTEFLSPDGASKVIEFSTSPLSQFYQPFERTYRQIEDTDIAVHSHPWGITKFGALHFDTSRDDEWIVEFELIVDGSRAWSKRLTFASLSGAGDQTTTPS